MSLPDQLLLSDLLARRVRCDRGLEHGPGVIGWMHPPVHRLLGWASRPSALSTRRCIWRLDQLDALSEGEVRVQGDPADTDPETLERLPTLLGAALLSGAGETLGRLADAAFERRTGRILHYLVARSDPRLPGGSRWRLSPDRIVDQRAGEVATALEGLGDLPLARASLRETLLRRSRLWRDQWDEETSRLRHQWQQTSGHLEERLEGWLEEPPWDEPRRQRPQAGGDQEIWPEEPLQQQGRGEAAPDAWEPWFDEDDPESPSRHRSASSRGAGRSRRFGRGLPGELDEVDGSQAWPDSSEEEAPSWWDGEPRARSARASGGDSQRRAEAGESGDPWV